MDFFDNPLSGEEKESKERKEKDFPLTIFKCARRAEEGNRISLVEISNLREPIKLSLYLGLTSHRYRTMFSKGCLK